MDKISALFTLITAVLHLWFYILETFLWTTPLGVKVFKMHKEQALLSEKLAANQGVYNGLLALGLILSFFIPNWEPVRLYCLIYIVIAGLYGAYSLKNIKIFAIQSLPALIALILLLV